VTYEFGGLVVVMNGRQVSIDLDIAMELFQAADRFGVDRLKKMCESKMLASISIDNAATIFYAADIYNAVGTSTTLTTSLFLTDLLPEALIDGK